ncbi:MAG TPA: TetR/AcrR family transcriptional regulator, partial [Ramlibacter sp.]|nr:TetR/AcrR family transcriptional regulator [Ramlibacter sp.]
MRPPLTQEKVAEFRSHVCRVAQALFARQGVEGVTMRQIAAELDCSSTTAYRYFKNKEEILAAVRAAAFNRFCEAIEAATRSSRDPRDSARKAGQAYLSFALANPDSYRMMFDVNQPAMTGHPELSEAIARAHCCMVTYVKPLIAEGVLRGDARSLGRMLWAAAHGLVMLRLSGIIATDAELRRLHEKTMSSLVRGANQMVAA